MAHYGILRVRDAKAALQVSFEMQLIIVAKQKQLNHLFVSHAVLTRTSRQPWQIGMTHA